MANFVVTPEDIQNFLVKPSADNQEGILFAYEANPGAVESVLPVGLHPVDNVVKGYAVVVQDPSFSAPYMEVSLFVNAEHDGVIQPYFLAGAVHGPGTESRMVMGTQAYGFPLKRAEDILVRRQGDRLYFSIVRRGSLLMELEAQTGGFNSAKTADLFAPAGAVWSYKYRAQQQPDGTTPFSDVRLISVKKTIETELLEPASILGVNITTTPDDPWGVLAMAKPLGAAWVRISKDTIEGTKIVDTVDSAKAMPLLMAPRFDRGLMTKFANREFNI